MDTGRLLWAQQQGTYVIKLVGEIRMTLSSTLESCIKSMLERTDFKALIVDVTQTDTIDSTSLGLLARTALATLQRNGQLPVLVSTNEDITRIILSMGFKDRVYRIVTQHELEPIPSQEVARQSLDEQQAHHYVLEAHRVLMSLNQANHDAFKDLVTTLEQTLSVQ